MRVSPPALCRAGARASRISRPASRVAAALGLAIGLALATPPAARAAVYMTQDRALAEAFPGARLDRRAYTLTEARVREVQQRARVRLSSRLPVAYAAWRGDTLVGTAFFDTRNVRTMPAVLMVVVAPDTTVARVDILAFHEPPDYRPPDRWLATFRRHPLNDRLWPRRDVRNLAGATLSTRAVTEGVRQALALYAAIVAPDLARTRAR